MCRKLLAPHLGGVYSFNHREGRRKPLKLIEGDTK
nr:MAG TPA: hypothetical protein [Caudoviricetes sp.]